MLDPVRLVEALAEDRAGLPQDRLREDLGSAAALSAWIAGREVLTIQELDRCEPDPSDPAKDTAGKVERDQKLEPGKAKAKTRKAEQMKSLPETQKALENGEVSEAHAQALADVRAKADAKARAALEQNEKRLLAIGKDETAKEFRRRLERFVKVHSEDDGRSEHDRKNARQRLSAYWDRDGMLQLRGSFGPEAGQRVIQTLGEKSEELFRRDHRDHPEAEPVPTSERTNEQRLAEALDLLCRRDRGRGPAKNNDRAVVILSYEDLLAKLEAAGIASTLADGTPVPASVARRMACDAGIIPLVLGGDSVPLDLGRVKRTASPGQRLALKALWSTCSIADCRAPFAWCEIHHIEPFNEDGRFGPTDLANLTPACDHCHDLAHTPGWDVAKESDGTVVTTAPDGTTWRRRPDRCQPEGRPAEPPPAAASEPGPSDAPAATLFTHAA